MSRIAIALAILALSVGCTAATTTGSHAATDGRLVDDAQLYSAAYESAVDALEATPSEGFDAHLARALGAIGLTPRG
ncbi:MAG: hypothetical protein KC619_34405, partial [Myxococcales bacterium]|nr:hypothetical protein [Myxococcales bacterium]